jgi:hypothetical protein
MSCPSGQQPILLGGPLSTAGLLLEGRGERAGELVEVGQRRTVADEAEGGADGIVVRRRVGGGASTEALWMDDLWLAERLADAAGSSRRRS